MSVDQARNDSLAFEIYYPSASGWSEVVLLDRGNALAGDEDRDLVSRLIGEAVDQPGVLKQ